MTIPNLQIPDTRPGQVIQSPGLGGALAGGLADLLQALIAGKQQNQVQQGLGLRGQELQQQGEYQRGMLQNDAALRELQQRQFLYGILGDTMAGQAAQGIGSPSQVSVNVPLPEGGTMPLQLPVGQAGTVQQAVRSLPPQFVGKLTSQAKDLIDAARKKEELALMHQQLNAYVSVQPPEEQARLAPLYQLIAASGEKPTADMLNAMVNPDSEEAKKWATYASLYKPGTNMTAGQAAAAAKVKLPTGVDPNARAQFPPATPWIGTVETPQGPILGTVNRRNPGAGVTQVPGVTPKLDAVAERLLLWGPSAISAKQQYDSYFAKGGPISLAEIRASERVLQDEKNAGRDIRDIVGTALVNGRDPLQSREQQMVIQAVDMARAKLGIQSGRPNDRAVTQLAVSYLANKKQFDAAYAGMANLGKRAGLTFPGVPVDPQALIDSLPHYPQRP